MLVFVIFLLLALFLSQSDIFAVNCTTTLTGAVNVASSCNFGGTVNGVENGNLTVTSGGLTINAGQTVVWNPGYSVSKCSTCAIIIGQTGSSRGALKRTYLWVQDADGDGWPASATPNILAQDTQPAGYTRRGSMNASSYNSATGTWTADCNDSAFSATNSCCSPNQGQACSTCNSTCPSRCNSGTYQCDGSCSATDPGLPANWGQACQTCNSTCPSVCNSGTYGCSGCSASAPGTPYTVGAACQACSCAGTGSYSYNNGTITNACTGACSVSAPTPPYTVGAACQACNCGNCNNGTITNACTGACSVSAPASPYFIGQGCGPYCNSCNTQCTGTGTCTNVCTCACSTGGAPPNPYYIGQFCGPYCNSCGGCTGTGGCTNVCSCACSTGGAPATYCENLGCYAGCNDPCVCP